MRQRWLQLWAIVLLLLTGSGCVAYNRELVRVERDLEYARVAGDSLRLDLYRPTEPTNDLPVLIWIHGGAWKSGSKARCPLVFLAEQGVAVVSLEYRLTDAAAFPAQLYDCKGAIRWLRANAGRFGLDRDRIGVLGASAGGHLAALLGTTADRPELEGDVGGNLGQSSRVQAVCAFYPPVDLDRLVTNPKWRVSPTSDVARFLGGPLVDRLPEAARANPITYITPDDTPFFLLHGDRDRLVPVEQSRLLHDALLRGGVETHLAIVPGKGHAIGAPPDVAQEILEFFQRHLRFGP